jgi:hypothetical protein
MKIKIVVTIILAAILSAIVLVGAVSSYLTETTVVPKADIAVEVVYAYIGQPSVNSNTTGLYYNVTKASTDYSLSSYIVVLKVTNNAAESAKITDFRVFVAPNIKVFDAFFTQSNGSPVPGPMGLPALEVNNALISDQRAGESSGAWANVWQPGSTRLVAISGMTSFNKFEEQYLQNGTLYIYGNASGEPAYTSGKSDGVYDLKHVTFQSVGDGFLYNDLLSKNQSLLIDGLDARVSPSQ